MPIVEDNEFRGEKIYEMFLGRVMRVYQQVGEDTNNKRLVCDVELDKGGVLNDVPFYGGGVDSDTEFPHGIFIPPRKDQLVCVGFVRGHYANPVCCFPLPHPSWKLNNSQKEIYNEILSSVDDAGVFHFSGTRLILKNDGKIEIGKMDGTTYRRLEIDFSSSKITIDTPNNESIELGENIAKQLVNNLPNCIYSGAVHAIGNTKIKV